MDDQHDQRDPSRNRREDGELWSVLRDLSAREIAQMGLMLIGSALVIGLFFAIVAAPILVAVRLFGAL